jgi:hypothetical protein
VERDLERDEPPDREPEPDAREDDPPEREEPLERDDPDERDAPDERDEADDRDEPREREGALDRDDDARVAREREVDDDDAGLRRSAAGTSSVTTAFVSCGISFCRKLAMRSSWRRYSRASFAVSVSCSDSASVSIAV